ncbi:MAG TPA: hypothetical protein VHN80_09985 [Kineosporiaceae bacterium]|nr:hypothetical protein [Kineosporiaceae bacterium]
MPSDNPKSRATRIRRAARRQGIEANRSRRRDPRALDYGWSLDDPRRDVHLTGLTIDEVEHYLATGEPPAS